MRMQFCMKKTSEVKVTVVENMLARVALALSECLKGKRQRHGT